MEMLRQLIQQTIEPDTWQLTPTQQQLGQQVSTPAGTLGIGQEEGYEPGMGTIEFYQNKYMVVRHTLEVHREIEKLLNQMRKSLGEQVSIEARFLVVGESFLEDIGLDMDFIYDPGQKLKDRIDISQTSYEAASPTATKVPGSLVGTVAAMITGGYGNIFLDDLQVDFMIRATQAHRDSKMLTAPKVTVLSGETASISVTTYTQIAMLPMTGQTTVGTVGTLGQQQQQLPVVQQLTTGPQLTVTPIISQDKKHVLLNITAMVNDFLGMKKLSLSTTTINDEGEAVPVTYTSEMPETEMSTVQTRVSVPDEGTLLLGGLKITVEEEREVGVPVLSKIPIIGRVFDNRSKVKDNKILLILVKPTIILQEEKDDEAIAATELVF